MTSFLEAGSAGPAGAMPGGRSASFAEDGPGLVQRGGRMAMHCLDHLCWIAFILYAARVLVQPRDGQIVAEMGAAAISQYKQLIPGSIGQVAFALYALLRAHVVIRALGAFVSVVGALALMALLSAAWSISPVDTLHRGFDLLLCVLFPALFVRLLGFEQCVRVAWLTLSAVLLVSAALAAAGSDYAIMHGQHEGHWRGLFVHKNAFGPFALCVFIFSLFLPAAVTRATIAARAVAAVALPCVVMSSSATALVALPIAVAAALAVRFFIRSAMPTGLILGIELGGLAAVAASGFGIARLVFNATGRDFTFTGRLGMWQAALPYSFAAPFGYGYGLGGGAEVLAAARRAGYAAAPSLHSGYITMALDLGWPAVAVFALFLLSRVMLVRRRERAIGPYAVVAAGLAMANLCAAVTESDFGAYLGTPLLLIMLMAQAPARVADRR
jgi:O-antigen ligase